MPERPLVPDTCGRRGKAEGLAQILQRGSGHFRLQAEVGRFFRSHTAFAKDAKGLVRNQLANDLLTRPLYAGYAEAPDWGVSLRTGGHEGLISFETFERIQKRPTEGANLPARRHQCRRPLARHHRLRPLRQTADRLLVHQQD